MTEKTINRTAQTMVRLTPPVRHELEAIAAEERRTDDGTAAAHARPLMPSAQSERSENRVATTIQL
jgi:hypothetical protein